ncbi:retrovirus-related pol polyprotein from transposon TNT 1-94 [Tanacetum coccineum]
METIHIEFGELTAMAFEQFGSGLELQLMTPGTISSGLAQNPSPLTPYVPPTKKDWNILFQPMFDKYFRPPSVLFHAPTATVAPIPIDTTGTPFSTSADQDAPSASTSPTTKDSQEPVLHQDVKLDEFDGVLKNKARLVAKVYVSEPEGFVDPDHPNYVYTLKKALYGLKQAPRAWKDGKDILLVQIYVDAIIFASTDPALCNTFADIMGLKFKMSMMGKMPFFLGLQISQSPRGIFINQSKYALEILKKYGMESSDPVDTPMEKPTEKHLHVVKRVFQYLKGTINMGLWYLKDTGIALTAYADADHVGCQDTRRSTSSSAQLLGSKLVSWSSKKQKSTAISTTETEYIALSG